ncbi:Mitochondrial brown fat uncoupling protein [Corchorus olitorius]|uniref:Mitochondrial brown fat uncoupling protein n=1 Tax=Corchorus olitorius TaxID=93759 RepID=A0A1R3J6R7_9ROSI|nr:Mitochondrial brown fat uncoupling protein [Corchorus olitorius]
MADLKFSFAETFLCSAFAACFAEFFTIPLDTAKVRLQLQKKAVGDDVTLPKYRGLLGTMATIAKEEGLSALWKGIIAGLHRQCIYGGLRIGLYEPVKTLLVGSDYVGDIPLYQKIIAALLTGALAIAVANPTDLVKVRLQAEGKFPVGVARRYYGTLDAYYTIVRQEGFRALWTGLGPNIARNAIVNAAELASYDQVKQTIMKIPGFSDNVLTHLLAGLGAAKKPVLNLYLELSTTGYAEPVCHLVQTSKLLWIGTVKSRMMGDSGYKNTLDCFIKTLKNEGILAFYKGFLPNFSRLGSWNAVMFLTLEQARKAFRGELYYD